MVLRNDVKASLNIRYQNVPILHVNSKLFLKGLMHMHTRLDIYKAPLVLPVSIERNRHSLIHIKIIHSISQDQSGSTYYGHT